MSTTSVVALTFRAFDLVGYYELGADLQAALVAASPASDRFGCGWLDNKAANLLLTGTPPEAAMHR
jgi:hypothetical protein